jgi:serine/threonine-protein kinase
VRISLLFGEAPFMQGRVYLGRYETVRLIGEGGMGRVYLAQQTDLGRQVVVKVMHEHIAADPVFRERFTRETQVMAKFLHPYAVTLLDAKIDDADGSCIVMEYIRGVTLEDVLRGGQRMEPWRVGRLLRMVCEVLQVAHDLGIVHRDLKPANLMIVDAGTNHEMLKVMDFGLAKMYAADRPGPVEVSNAEFAVGTPGYMCPEQARGEPMDGRGDLYSMGVILFEMLTGRTPFAGRSTMEVLLAHATEEPPSFSQVGASGSVPTAIEEVVRWCLAKNASDRPPNARALAEAFEAVLAEQTPRPLDRSPAPEPPPIPGGRPRQALAVTRPSPLEHSPVDKAPPADKTIPAASAPSTPTPPTPNAPVAFDPLAVVNHLEAWMPEKIATYKLRGFIHDVGGELVESVPGRIRVRLGGKGCVYAMPSRGALSWIGLGRKGADIDMELRLHHAEQRDNQLRITVLIKPAQGDLTADLSWRGLCNQIYCDLRAYLMGSSSGVEAAV